MDRNLDNEGMFLQLLAIMEASDDPEIRDAARGITAFVAQNLTERGQQKRFRIIFGKLAKQRTEVETEDGGFEVVDSGLIFIKNFNAYSLSEKMELCRAVNILESEEQQMLDGIKSRYDSGISRANEILEKVHKVLEPDPPYKGFFGEIADVLFFWRKKKSS